MTESLSAHRDGAEREDNLPRAGSDPSRTIVIVNDEAGEVLENSQASFAALIGDSFIQHGVRADVRFVPAREIPSAFEQAASDGEALPVIAGGDGTLSALLPSVVDGDREFALLPLGTLNVTAKDLGFGEDVRGNVEAIVRGSPAPVDVGVLNGRPFHVSVGMGFFGTMASERQAARRLMPFSKRLGYLWASLRAFLLSRPLIVECRTADGRIVARADAVVVTNNRFDGAPRRRERLDAGLLEAHVLKADGLRGRVSVLLAILRGRWRDHPNLKTLSGAAIVITTRGRKRRTISIDGEVVRMTGPFHFSLKAAAIKLRAAGPRNDAR